jgi:anti-anti-sigma regulatory factor
MANSILKVQETEQGITMAFEGDFTAANVEVIKEALLQSAARNGNEILSLIGATSIDASGIQLAFSWKKILEARGRKADVLLPQLENIKELLIKTGITTIL